MPSLEINRECKVDRTARVQQLSGLFDLPTESRSVEHWKIDLHLPEKWNVGLVVGPSGSGKTTLIDELWSTQVAREFKWHKTKSILDGFPSTMGIKDIVQLLSSVGFSSPPSWLRPFHVLSNGEKFRASIARVIAEQKGLSVVDEFSSVVDRTVAKIGSAAIAKTVRKRNQQFIAVSCHYDILEWLSPDWVFQPHLNKLDLPRGSLQRPSIDLEIKRVHSSAWSIFKKYHYLSAELNPSSVCFVAFWKGVPVAFDSWLPFVGRLRTCVKARRVHRTVCLPDYQGVGIGNALFECIASAWSSLGYRALYNTSHPAIVSRLARSRNWRMNSVPKVTPLDGPGMRGSSMGRVRSHMRWIASFEYIGQPMKREEAQRLVYGTRDERNIKHENDSL